jgi:hypothetical protein
VKRSRLRLDRAAVGIVLAEGGPGSCRRPPELTGGVALTAEFDNLDVLMARKAFYSFHYKPDNWRAAQVRQMGVIEGNAPASDNDWESVTKGGDEAIKQWIDGQLSGKSCAIVLIGANTAGRKWINYEIVKAWNDNKGVLGIYIHNLKDNDRKQSSKGSDPFDYVTLGTTGAKLSTVVKAYDPPYSDSSQVYGYIKDNLSGWIEVAIKTREAN